MFFALRRPMFSIENLCINTNKTESIKKANAMFETLSFSIKELEIKPTPIRKKPKNPPKKKQPLLLIQRKIKTLPGQWIC